VRSSQAFEAVSRVVGDHDVVEVSSQLIVAVVEERAEDGSEALPVDRASEPHQGMAALDSVHERRAEEFGLLGR
jgi:hypothetical protein